MDWAGIGDANATYGIAGGQPIAGLSQIGWGNGLTLPGAIAPDSDTLARTYQLNEKLTWLRGRHALKFGGQFLHYNQRRFYAGNNGLLGSITYNGTFTGSAFSDFLLDQVNFKGRGGGDPEEPWTHLQNRISLFAQDDFKVRRNLTLNLGLRWAYTSPLVEKDNRQSTFDLTTGEQIFAKDGSIEDRALYKPYYKGYEPRLGFAWSPTERVVVRGGYGISQFMEGTGANLRLPLNPPLFYESGVTYDLTTGSGTDRDRFCRIDTVEPSRQAMSGPYDPNLRPQFTHQWNAFVEYRLTTSMSAQVGYVGHRADHLITPTEGNQALPGVGDPATWASKTTRRPLFGVLPLVTTIATTTSRSGSEYDSMQASLRQRSAKGVEFLASYTLGKTRTNNRGFYGVFGGTGLQGVTSATEGAYWQNTYDPDAEWGPAFHDVRHNFIFSSTYELPFGRGRTWGANGRPWSTRCSGDGGLAASSRRGADCRSPSSTASTVLSRVNAAPSGPTASAIRCPRISRSRTGWISPLSAGRTRHIRQLPGGSREGPRLRQPRSRAVEAVRHPGARSTPSSGSRLSTPSTTRVSALRVVTSTCRRPSV